MSAEAWVEQTVSDLRMSLRRLAGSLGPDSVFPSAADLARAIEALTPEHEHPLAGLVGPFWSAPHTRTMLGIRTRQALHSRVQSGSVLAVPAGANRNLYPLFQFVQRGGTVVVREALIPLFAGLRGLDPWTIAQIAVTPTDELAGLTPVEWSRQSGEPQQVRVLAERLARLWELPPVERAVRRRAA